MERYSTATTIFRVLSNLGWKFIKGVRSLDTLELNLMCFCCCISQFLCLKLVFYVTCSISYVGYSLQITFSQQAKIYVPNAYAIHYTQGQATDTFHCIDSCSTVQQANFTSSYFISYQASYIQYCYYSQLHLIDSILDQPATFCDSRRHPVEMQKCPIRFAEENTLNSLSWRYAHHLIDVR